MERREIVLSGLAALLPSGAKAELLQSSQAQDLAERVDSMTIQQATFTQNIGGGGGSGAYYEGIINVMPGNVMTITIPGGGSSAQLQLRMENRGILKMSSGKTATESKAPRTFNADGGRVEMISGIFEENLESSKRV